MRAREWRARDVAGEFAFVFQVERDVESMERSRRERGIERSAAAAAMVERWRWR